MEAEGQISQELPQVQTIHQVDWWSPEQRREYNKRYHQEHRE